MFRTKVSNTSFLAAAAFISVVCLPLYAEAVVDQEGYHGIEQQAPIPPQKLELRCRDHKLLEIKWNDIGPSVSEYRLFRFDNTDPDKTLKIVAVITRNKYTPNKVVYSDNSIEVGTTYTYFLTSENQFGSQSQNSQLVTDKCYPKPTDSNAR